MKKIFTILVLLIALKASAMYNPLTGTIWYVRADGLDSHTGTTNSAGGAFLTNVKAMSMAVAGDSVVVALGGTYPETSQVSVPAGVSWHGIDSSTCIIKSTVTTTFTAIVNLASGSEGTNGNQVVSGLKFDGNNLACFWGIYVQGRKNVSIHDIQMRNFLDNGIHFTGRVDNALSPPTIYATGNYFYNSTILNCSRFTSFGEGCLDISGQDSMVIHDNIITQDQRAASDNGYCIKFSNTGWNRGCKIYNNTFKRSLFNGFSGLFDFCIEAGNISGWEVYSNTFNTGSFDTNFQTYSQGGKTYPYSLYLHGNTFTCPFEPDHDQHGAIIEFASEGVIIDSNYFYNVTRPVLFVPRTPDPITHIPDTLRYITISRNLMKNIAYNNDPANGIRFGELTDSVAVYSVNIYNNTIDPDPAKASNLGISLPQGSNSSYHGINIKNNIILNSSVAAIGQAGTTKVDTLHIQYNNLYNNAASTFYVSTTPTVDYLFNNITTTNPLLTSSLDTLSTSSPARNAGVNVGFTYAGLAPDLGYYELVLPVVPPTANAGTNQTITLPTNTVTLSGSGIAGTNSISSVSWRQISGPVTGVILSSASYTTDVNSLTGSGVYNFELAVISTDGSTGKDTVVITVNPAPLVNPSANAGSDQTITLPTNQVTMSGIATAGTYAITSTVWGQYLGATVTITTSTSPTTTITGLTVAGIYGFVFTVTDNHGNVTKDSMTVTVNPSGTTPVVSFTTPINGATGVAITVHPTATFSIALASGTVNTTNVTMTQAGNVIPITVSLNSNVITITPVSSLTNNLVYVITFGAGITSSTGTPIAGPYAFSFTTTSDSCTNCIITDKIVVGGH